MDAASRLFCPCRHKHAASAHVAGFGGHSIGLLGSLCLVTNNVMGPGMMTLPATLQQSGWLPSLVMLAFVAVATTQASVFMARAAQSFRGNRKFEVRLEFGSLALHLFPRWLYNATIATLVVVFFCNNLANIIITSQTMDDLILHVSGRACAWPLGAPGTWRCVDSSSGSAVTDSLFGDDVVVSTGFLVTLVAAVPIGYLNLEDSIVIQIAGMALTLVCVAVWAAQFVALGLKPALMPAFGEGGGAFTYISALPTILFNYGFVATLPSWLNEKDPKVELASTIWYSQALATGQYLVFALLAALAIDFSSGLDALSMINNGGLSGVWEASKVMTFVFPIANVYTSIPVFSIIVRYNLLQLDGCKPPVWAANLFAVVLPWVVAVPFFAGNGLDNVINWSSAILFCALNMGLPVAFYVAVRRSLARGEVPVVLEEGYQNLTDEDAAAADAAAAAAAAGDAVGINAGAAGAAKPLLGGEGEGEGGGEDGGAAAAAAEDVPLPCPCCCGARGQLPWAYTLIASGVLCGVVALTVQIAKTAFPDV